MGLLRTSPLVSFVCPIRHRHRYHPLRADDGGALLCCYHLLIPNIHKANRCHPSEFFAAMRLVRREDEAERGTETKQTVDERR